jgi:hypothetical protein
MSELTDKEVNLQIPDSLFLSLTRKAKQQGVSIEALCVSLLEGEQVFVEPSLYPSMGNGDLRTEIQKLMQSSLPKDEVNKRVRKLEAQLLRLIR